MPALLSLATSEDGGRPCLALSCVAIRSAQTILHSVLALNRESRFLSTGVTPILSESMTGAKPSAPAPEVSLWLSWNFEAIADALPASAQGLLFKWCARGLRQARTVSE